MDHAAPQEEVGSQAGGGGGTVVAGSAGSRSPPGNTLVTTTTISEEVRPTGQRMRVLGMEQKILDNLTSSASAETEAPAEDVGCGVPADQWLRGRRQAEMVAAVARGGGGGPEGHGPGRGGPGGQGGRHRDLPGRHPLWHGELWSADWKNSYLCQRAKREYSLRSIARSSANGASLLLAGAGSASAASTFLGGGGGGGGGRG